MSAQPERREALPAGLAAPAAWQLRVDGLVAQPLALSLPEVDALGAQAHTADFVCEEGWMVPEQRWEGVGVTAILGRAGVQPEARFLKVYAGNFTVLLLRVNTYSGYRPRKCCWMRCAIASRSAPGVTNTPNASA